MLIVLEFTHPDKFDITSPLPDLQTVAVASTAISFLPFLCTVWGNLLFSLIFCEVWHSICLAILEWDMCLLPCHHVCALLMSWESWWDLAGCDCCLGCQSLLSSSRDQRSSLCPAHRFSFVCININNNVTPATVLKGYSISKKTSFC